MSSEIGCRKQWKTHVTSSFDFYMQGVQNICTSPGCSILKNKYVSETRLTKKKQKKEGEIDKTNYLS